MPTDLKNFKRYVVSAAEQLNVGIVSQYKFPF